MRFASLGHDEGDILDDADGFLVGESFVSLFVWFEMEALLTIIHSLVINSF